MATIQYKEYTHYNQEEILALYRSVGWAAYHQNPDSLEQGFRHSLYTLGAYEGETLVGLIRVVGDGHTIIYIQDILVLPQYQGRKIGSQLMQRVLERYAHVRQVMLATEDRDKTVGFYQSLGFQKLTDVNCVGFTYVGRK